MIRHLSLCDFTTKQQVSIYSFTIGLEKEKTTFGHNCIKSTLHCFFYLFGQRKSLKVRYLLIIGNSVLKI